MRGERGQILPLRAAVMVVCGLAAVGLGRLGSRAIDRARAQAAADAGALAGTVGGDAGAGGAVEANGGRVVAFRSDGVTTNVEVEVGGARATAAARGGPGGGGEPGPGAVAPGLRAVLARAAALLGGPVPVVMVLDRGLEVDIDPAAAGRVAAVAEAAGLCRPGPTRWPARFGICPPPASALAGGPDGG